MDKYSCTGAEFARGMDKRAATLDIAEIREEPGGVDHRRHLRRIADIGIDRIGGISIQALVDMARGSPEHDQSRYSDAETRMARIIFMLRSRCANLAHEFEPLSSDSVTP